MQKMERFDYSGAVVAQLARAPQELRYKTKILLGGFESQAQHNFGLIICMKLSLLFENLKMHNDQY